MEAVLLNHIDRKDVVNIIPKISLEGRKKKKEKEERGGEREGEGEQESEKNLAHIFLMCSSLVYLGDFRLSVLYI